MVRLMRIRSCAAILLIVAACSSKDDSKPERGSDMVEGPGKTILGIDPPKWTCDVVAAPPKIAEVLGGEIAVLDSPFTPPRGVPEPCNYTTTRPGPPRKDGDAGTPMIEAWTFDLDCRPDYEERAELLFAEYARTSEELVAEYQKRTTGPGIKPPTDDAGVPLRAPQAHHEAIVGRKALDHHGQGLLFLDDDAPCYVRVVGPDAERRLALAQLVAAGLSEANAPMKPHGDPIMKK
jgi:hypothetical protein